MTKRWIALVLCLCMAFSLTACGTRPQQNIGSASGEASEPEDTSVPEPEQEPEPKPETEPDSAEDENQYSDLFPFQAFTVDGEKDALDGTESNPLFLLNPAGGEVSGDDGTVLVTYGHQAPQIRLDDETAQADIQADLDQIIGTFQRFVDEDLTEQAKEMYDTIKEENTVVEGEFDPLYAQLSIKVTRFDEKVLSLVIDNVGYSGGAHGWDNRYCANYDLQTGEKITFEMLGQGFRAAAEERVLTMADEMQAEQVVFFEDYANSIPTVVTDGTETISEVYAKVYPDLYGPDASWEAPEGNMSCQFYLTDEGVTFISGEYAMQSYAAGIIEFPFPYASFDGIINQQYVK